VDCPGGQIRAPAVTIVRSPTRDSRTSAAFRTCPPDGPRREMTWRWAMGGKRGTRPRAVCFSARRSRTTRLIFISRNLRPTEVGGNVAGR